MNGALALTILHQFQSKATTRELWKGIEHKQWNKVMVSEQCALSSILADL